jgi:hypothetical protein
MIRTETVNEEYIEGRGTLRNELRAIFTKYPKPLIDLGNSEHISHRNDVRIDLYNS